MARQVLPIVGAVVGAFFGSPQIGYAIGAVVGNLVDPVINQGPKIGETGAQTSQEGAPRAIIFGTASCTGNIIAAGPIIKSTETEEVDGGKGSEKSENEHAYRNYAIRICEGPIGGILRIWEDDKLVYDVRAGSLMLAESQKWIGNKNIFLGDEDQLPSAFLNLNVPPLGDHPAHRGTAYIVFGLEDLTDRRGSIPQYRFEVARQVTPSVVTLPRVTAGSRQLSGQTGGGTSIDMSNDIVAMEAPGDVWLGYFSLYSSAGDTSLTLWIKIDDIFIWSKNVVVPAAASLTTRVQINKKAGAQTIQTGFTGTLTGTWTVAVIAVNGDANYSAFSRGLEAPIYYESDNADFGIVKDEAGAIYSMQYLNTSAQEMWGPPTIEQGFDGLPQTLADIVAEIHDRCNVSATKYDVSELDDEVAGLVLAGDYSGADAINTLRGPYFFDKAEYSRKLHYPKRGASVLATLTIDDLVEEPDLSKREQPVEFPKKMHLFYQHAASGYAAVKATSLRSSPDARVVGETSLQVPVVLNEDQAAQAVSKLHKVSWAEAEGEVSLSIPQSFIRFVPSNPLGLILRGQAKRLRLERKEFTEGKINLVFRHDRQSAYTSNLTGVPIPPPTLPPSTIVGDTTLAILDISSRIDTEDDLHYLSAGVGALPAWYGYALQRSFDGGATYATVDRFGSSVIGVLQTDIPSASEYFTDTTNTVRIELIRDGQTLEDLTDVQFLSEQGAFALEKEDGSWEVMQYRDVVEESSGVLSLHTLHRGLLNSGASSHVAGAKFVLLSRAEHIPAISAWIGQSITHRAASLGDSPELATPQTATFVGRSQIEWPVASFVLNRAGNVVAGTWAPRHRFGTDDVPVASINFTGYRVSIVGTSTVTFDTLSPNFTYDVSAIGGGVTVSVSALNRITGAGPSTSGAI